MKWVRLAVIACLAFVAFGVWGVVLLSGLLSGTLISPEPADRSGAVESPTQVAPATPATPLLPGITRTPPGFSTPSFGPLPTATVRKALTPTAAATPTPSPSPTATKLIRSPTPTPSATASATRLPPPTPLPLSALTLTPPASGRFLLVDQDKQLMQVYENATLIKSIPVSTGAPVEDMFTPAWRGQVGAFWGKAMFRNTNLWADYIWYLFPGAQGSILIHSAPYTRNGDEKIYDRLDALGVQPASKGCVRISPQDAAWLAQWNPVGVLIEITPWTGDIKPVANAQ
jgi:lipoprotein-anchoring transpeptidase ErfK/SrfK